MSRGTRVLAVDLGATSVRVAAVDLDRPVPQIDIVHRWAHGPVRTGESLRWNWSRIVTEVKRGIDRGLMAGPVASIGIDGWGVDYGLIDERGDLVAPPYSYRDGRTSGWAQTAEKIGSDRLYDLTGIQLVPFNTIFQLAAHERAELDQASRLLLLPDLLVRELGGDEAAEKSNASTTGLLNTHRGHWAEDLIDALGLDTTLFPAVEHAGRNVGAWEGVPLHLVGSHDTASAFMGMPATTDHGTVFVSTGTWVIVGIELDQPNTSPEAQARNFSNEAGALGGIRFLKNVIGFWLLEQCRPAWDNASITALLEEAATVRVEVPVFDATDSRFLNPDDMEAEIRSAAGLAPSEPRAVVIRSALESIAAGVGSVIAELTSITGNPMKRIGLVGGGARSSLLRDRLAARTGLPVVLGSPEATALGNAVVQGIALGNFRDISEAREWIGAAA
ncbi:MAG: rhamnulokinase [Acidimicrobiia bacterium]